MPVLPKPFFALRASWHTARIARQLSRPNTAGRSQQQTLAELLGKIAETAYGRDLGISSGMSYGEFRSRVPLRDHGQLEPYFRRIRRGEPNVLWPGHCHYYAETAGTTDKPKWLPITEDILVHFENSESDALLYYAARIGDSAVFRGRHLALAPLLTVVPIAKTELSSVPPEPTAGSSPPVSPSWGAPQLAEPANAFADTPEWSARIEAIITRTLKMDITLVAGVPNWLLVFSDALRGRAIASKMLATALNTIWSNLECVIHYGIPVSPFQEELKRTAGYLVNLHEIYFATEAFIAAQDSDAASGLRLMQDSGVFYEFLPLRDFDESLPLSIGARALAVDEVRTDEDYVLVLTTPAGLCRYVVGDIVRFVSIEPPRLIHVGRTQLRLNAFEENLLEKELTDSIVAVCQRHNWTITNFHVAPLVVSSLIGQTRGRHEWWVELRPNTNETPTGPIIAGHLDVDLATRSESYARKRLRNQMDAPIVRLVMPGFFAHWLDDQKMWGGQKKMPRCRSDRLIADEFSALACFTADAD